MDGKSGWHSAHKPGDLVRLTKKNTISIGRSTIVDAAIIRSYLAPYCDMKTCSARASVYFEELFK